MLLNEALDGLNICEDGIYVDCTFGRGGHSAEIAKQIGRNGHLYAFDSDRAAINAGRERFKGQESNVTLTHVNFREAVSELQAYGVDQVDGVLFDLGVSSPQLDDKSRGFSYRGDEPLDMRMDQRQSLTANAVVHDWSYEALVRIISQYGEEKFAKPIARAIESTREKHRIETTAQLSEIIKSAIPAAARRTGGHPAKRTFQAIRIAVNDELQSFQEALSAFVPMLNPLGGRIAVISFHSLEDKIAKKTLDTFCKYPELPPGLPVIPEDMKPTLKWINKKPIEPSPEEIEGNRRARSARLRIAEKMRQKEGINE